MRLVFLLFLVWVTVVAAQDVNGTDFGQVRISEPGQQVQTFPVAAAYLYQDVMVEYDTTAQIRGLGEVDLYFFPQIGKGDHNVLHIILADQDSAAIDPAYDLYFDLGDSLADSIWFRNASGNAYVFEGGKFPAELRQSSNESGLFNLLTEGNQNIVSGSFRIEFDYSNSNAAPSQLSISGDLKIPESYVLSGQATSLELREARRKDEFKRNMVIAVLTALFIVVGVGL